MSPVLYPFFVLSLDAGLRPSERRALRWCDLALRWTDGAISEGEIVVSRSKTEGGTGSVIPLTRRACAALTIWRGRFPESGPDQLRLPVSSGEFGRQQP
jgi:integrase